MTAVAAARTRHQKALTSAATHVVVPAENSPLKKDILLPAQNRQPGADVRLSVYNLPATVRKPVPAVPARVHSIPLPAQR